MLTALAPVATAQPAIRSTEVYVGTHDMIDYEFDWGRDGVYCTSCNHGAGNARFAFIDDNHDLWVGYVDTATGNFYPPNGKGVFVDHNATEAQEIGNGPEWMFSQRGSELVYTRWTDGREHLPVYLNLGFARMGDGSWIGGPISGTSKQVLPIGSLDLNDQTPAEHYQDYALAGSPVTLYWRSVTPQSTEHTIPITSTESGMTRRWVPNSRNIIITAPAAPDATGAVYDQVFLYRTQTNAVEQLTTDPVEKIWGWMFQAPEYGNEYLFFVVVGGNTLDIYRNLPAGDGTPKWTVVNEIKMPELTPYISSPEPFFLNGRTHIFFTLSSNSDLHSFTPSLVALTGIIPHESQVRILTSENDPERARRDPEYFITANGPYIYYNRYLLPNDKHGPINEGVYRVDTGLGPIIP